MIDLHTHSTASDGFLSPSELLHAAEKIGLEALALTDHDAVSGLDELHAAAAKNRKVEIVNGAELSVFYPGCGKEILALDIPEKSLPRSANISKTNSRAATKCAPPHRAAAKFRRRHHL